ncbi:MAG: glutathione S-transferase [Candidatus Protistobacter heckmanni]|nr:glutathione S-transferase [Candidatus Protistobacter heckmanni]
MLKLCGFAASNYHNKVKLALMEKGGDFEEKLVWSGEGNPSPLRKEPYVETKDGMFCESEVILEYIEDNYPDKPLLPKDPYQRSKVRELEIFLNLHLEIVVREIYPEAFFSGTVSDEVKRRTEKLLTKNIAGFAKLAQFTPYVAGAEFTIADCSAITHLPLVSMATKIIYGRDFLEDLPVRDYVKMMNEKPSMQKINADRKENTAVLLSGQAKN